MGKFGKLQCKASCLVFGSSGVVFRLQDLLEVCQLKAEAFVSNSWRFWPGLQCLEARPPGPWNSMFSAPYERRQVLLGSRLKVLSV